MCVIGSSSGTMSFIVNKTRLQSANWQRGDLVHLFDVIDESVSSDGFIFISSSIINTTRSAILVKPVSEISMPFPYISSGGSYFKKGINGVDVFCSGDAVNIAYQIGNQNLSLAATLSLNDDANASRHDIFNRDVNGIISTSQPYNTFLPGSVFANIDKSWINADTRISSSLGRHYFYDTLFTPITKRHLISFDASTSNISSVKYIDPVSGSTTVIPVIQTVNLGQAMRSAGVDQLANMPSSVYENIKISQLAVNIPASVRRVRFCTDAEVLKYALELPVYVVTYTRKIACVHGISRGDNHVIYSENLPAPNRLTGISSTNDFINFMNNGEQGHNLFAWDGSKSIFLGFVHSPELYTGNRFINDSWDGRAIGFNSQGAVASDFADSQHVFTASFDGYQFGLESEKILYMLSSNAVWDSPTTGEGLLLENQVSELDNTVNVPTFSNPVGNKRKIIQQLRL